MTYHFAIHKEDEGGYWAEGIELSSCFSQGDDLDELRKMLTEALNLHLDTPLGSNMLFAEPDHSLVESDTIMSIFVEPKIAFALQVKNTRIGQNMTQDQMCKILGLKNRTSYTRLENTKGNPKLETISMFMSKFPEFPLNEIFSPAI